MTFNNNRKKVDAVVRYRELDISRYCAVNINGVVNE